jgi:hypothetical protein
LQFFADRIAAMDYRWALEKNRAVLLFFSGKYPPNWQGLHSEVKKTRRPTTRSCRQEMLVEKNYGWKEKSK